MKSQENHNDYRTNIADPSGQYPGLLDDATGAPPRSTAPLADDDSDSSPVAAPVVAALVVLFDVLVVVAIFGVALSALTH